MAPPRCRWGVGGGWGRLSPIPASVKPANWKDTGDRFRSYVLGVMSPARYPCATPVNERGTQVPRTPPLRGGGLRGTHVPLPASAKPANWMRPATRFDRATSEL